MFYLGTHNAEKANNMRIALKLAIGDVALSDIFAFNISPPKETGETEIDRANLKSKYYFEHIDGTVISEDDGFYFENLPSIDGLSISDVNTGDLPAFDFWKDVFVKNNVIGGVLRKAYSIYAQDSHNSISVDIPFLISMSGKPSIASGNVLNQFIVPIGFQNPLGYMTDLERNEFRLRYLVDPIRSLFSAINLTSEQL